MQWNRGTSGFYTTELVSPDGVIKLSCSNWVTEGKKWRWRVEWPGGQFAVGEADTYAVCKQVCEWAAQMYEPFGDGFRKKPDV